MYTPGMSVMSLLLKNRYENKRIEISFMYIQLQKTCRLRTLLLHLL
jgi:hypothetical protein